MENVGAQLRDLEIFLEKGIAVTRNVQGHHGVFVHLLDETLRRVSRRLVQRNLKRVWGVD